jgi:hypothetical protein
VAAFTGLGGSIPMDWVATFTGIRKLTPQVLNNHCIVLNMQAKSQTGKNDVIWLKTAVKTMRFVKGFTFVMAVFDDVYETLRREN